MKNKERVKLLQEEISKRDKLIYAMMYNSHNYQRFMIKCPTIDDLLKLYKAEEYASRILAKGRIAQLHDNLF